MRQGKKYLYCGLSVLLLSAMNVQPLMAEETATKDETVYIKTNEDGVVNQVTVSDHIQSNQTMINDLSDLKDIKVVKGDTTFEQNQQNITWKTDQNGVYYQGNSNKELPVSYRMHYIFNGKEIKAADLIGKSGHVKIQIQYENHSSKDQYIPFVMITNIVLSDHFANVKIDHGKVLDDGQRHVVIGYGVPGLKEQLHTDLDVLADEFTVEADVNDYEQVSAITIASSKMFDDLLNHKDQGFDGMKNDFNTLKESSQKLKDGSQQMKQGLDTLSSKSKELSEGVNTLLQGSKQLNDGTGQLKQGSKDLEEGLNLVSNKVNQDLNQGIQALQDGLQEMQSKLSSDDGLPALIEAVSLLDQKISQGAQNNPSLIDSTSALVSNITQLQGYLNQLTSQYETFHQGINTIATGITTLNNQFSQIEQLNQTMQTTISALNQKVNGLQTENEITLNVSNVPVENVSGTVSGTMMANISTNINQNLSTTVSGALVNANEIGELNSILSSINDENLKGQIQGVITSLQSEKQVSVHVEQPVNLQQEVSGTVIHPVITNATGTVHTTTTINNPNVEELKESINQLSQMNSGLTNVFHTSVIPAIQQTNVSFTKPDNGILVSSNKINETLHAIKGGLDQYQNGLNQYKQGIEMLANNVHLLHAKTNGFQQELTQGINQFIDGTAQLHQGIIADNGLSNGIAKLQAGATILYQGTDHLFSGSNQLLDGLTTLNSGTNQMGQGIDTLDEGATSLAEGMAKFDQEGIQKLVDTLQTKLIDKLDLLKTFAKNGQAYQTFTNKAKDMDGEVKFVFISTAE